MRIEWEIHNKTTTQDPLTSLLIQRIGLKTMHTINIKVTKIRIKQTRINNDRIRQRRWIDVIT